MVCTGQAKPFTYVCNPGYVPTWGTTLYGTCSGGAVFNPSPSFGFMVTAVGSTSSCTFAVQAGCSQLYGTPVNIETGELCIVGPGDGLPVELLEFEVGPGG